MKELPSFDELKALAEDAPEKLEQLRLEMSQEIIDNAKEHRRKRLKIQLAHINRTIESGANNNQVNVMLMNALMQKFSHFSETLQGNQSDKKSKPVADISQYRSDSFTGKKASS